MGAREAEHQIFGSDIEYLVDHPWDITEKEWGLQDPSMRESLIAIIELRLEQSKGIGYSRIWKTQEGQPIALLGAYQVGEKKMETLFVASHHMKEYALRISFEMRSLLRDHSPNYQGYTCGLYSESDHPNQINWFRFLGFKYIPEKNNGKERYFEYVSPASKRE